MRSLSVYISYGESWKSAKPSKVDIILISIAAFDLSFTGEHHGAFYVLIAPRRKVFKISKSPFEWQNSFQFSWCKLITSWGRVFCLLMKTAAPGNKPSRNSISAWTGFVKLENTREFGLKVDNNMEDECKSSWVACSEYPSTSNAAEWSFIPHFNVSLTVWKCIFAVAFPNPAAICFSTLN